MNDDVEEKVAGDDIEGAIVEVDLPEASDDLPVDETPLKITDDGDSDPEEEPDGGEEFIEAYMEDLGYDSR